MFVSEVLTMAVDIVQVTESTSPLFEVFIVHRLGLVPLISEDIDNYNFPLKYDSKEGFQKCKVDYDTIVKSDIDVTYLDIKTKKKDTKVKPVEYDDQKVITKQKKIEMILK